MSYNPAIDMPKTMEERTQLVDYWHAKEDDLEAANPGYQKRTRRQIEEMFDCYYPLEMPED